MPDLWDLKQRWRRRWQRWRRQGQDRLQAWWTIAAKSQNFGMLRPSWAREQADHRSLTEVRMDVDTAAQEAMGKVIMAEMQAQTLRSIRQAVRAEILEEVHAEALELAKAELEDSFDHRRETLLDDIARQRHALEDEMLGELDRQRGQIRGEVTDELEEKILTWADECQEARAERDRAEGLLVQLIKQLLPGERPVYLYSAGVRELDRVALNETLARHGLQVRSRTTYSERVVKTRLDQDRWAGHTQFWLTPVSVVGVVEETDETDEQGELHTR